MTAAIEIKCGRGAETDELCVEFYECSACGFERVPHQQDNEYAATYSDAEHVTARFCPGCGARITWTW